MLHPAVADRAERRRAFIAAAGAAQALRHRNLRVPIDAGEDQGRAFIVMERSADESLERRATSLRELGQRLKRKQIARIVRDVAAGLTHAHANGVVHGDVRPANVILTSERAIVTGFAIGASLADGASDRAEVGLGDPPYMSPEQATGHPAGPESDLYSLGVIAYELLTGRPPYESRPPMATLLAHAHEPLPLPATREPHVGEATERVLLRALARDPADRYRTADELAAALERAIETDSRRGVTAVVVLPEEMRRATAAASPGRRLPRPVVLGLAASALIAMASVGALLTRALIAPAAPQRAAASPQVTVTAAPLATASAAASVVPTPSSPPPTPVATAAVPTAPAPTGPRVGSLLYEAKLDGSVELDDVHVFSGGDGDALVTFERGAIQLAVREPGGGTIGFIRMAPRTSYVGVFTVSVPRASEVLFTWALRRNGDASYLLRLDARTETLALLYDDGVRWRESLAPQVRIRDLRSARAVPIAFSAAGPDLAVYVDGLLVMQARDARIPNGKLAPDIFVGEEGGVGGIRLLSARLYALP